MAQAIQMVGTLGAKHLGDPTIVRTWSADEIGKREHKLGAIMGRVTGISLRSNVFNDEPSIAFVGVFEGIGDDGRRIRSSACFLPHTLNKMLAATVVGDHKLPIDKAPKRGQKIDVIGLNEIKFAVEISVQKDDSEVGFRYITRMHGHDAFLVSDPLSDLRQFIPGAVLDASLLSIGETPRTLPDAPTRQAEPVEAPAKKRAGDRRK